MFHSLSRTRNTSYSFVPLYALYFVVWSVTTTYNLWRSQVAFLWGRTCICCESPAELETPCSAIYSIWRCSSEGGFSQPLLHAPLFLLQSLQQLQSGFLLWHHMLLQSVHPPLCLVFPSHLSFPSMFSSHL